MEVLWEDGERVFCRERRLGADGKWQSVLVVLPTAERPPPSILDRLTHEYGLTDELGNAWALRPLELVRDVGRTMLVLDDPGGEPLARLLSGPMKLPSFLRIAIGIASALGKVHQRGLIHKDIKPVNIIVDSETGTVRLTGFGIASRLSRERQAPEPPEFIAGTLAYMAPEQTGRMNRSIDSRGDLYALGVTLYQMLTGVLPFTATDPMELVHCHIARRPLPPCERMAEAPPAVSAIITKLLSKAAEERYQTAAGLESDLRRCLSQVEAQHRIDNFPLGERDTRNRLVIPEKLYGREREIATLLSAFDRIVKGSVPELVLVSGYSGIGKSSVVNELHKVLVPPRGLFAAGKFDQYKRDIPYATLAQAFQSLIRELLAKSEADLAPWRDAFCEALGPNGQLMIDFVPELKLIIGDQPPVSELEPQQAQRRFQLVFGQFIDVFARAEHPLALFLDDLQWLDVATLDLLENLLIHADVQHLLLIGAYRDNEVDASHALMRKLDAVTSAGGKTAEIRLAPLAREHVEQLIADALQCESRRAAPLARLVHKKTDGNPFLLIQFLSALVEEDLLIFDHDDARWRWDLARIHAKGYTDSAVDLLVGRLARLPLVTQTALHELACLGNITEIAVLSTVIGSSEEELEEALRPAVRQELVERLAGAYRFVHDRVHEAAYGLIPEDERAAAHLRIGRLLAASGAPEAVEGRIFEIANHLNRGAELIATQAERNALAEINLRAGKRAKSSAAYQSALAYLTAGRALLPSDCWDSQYPLAFSIELHLAECEFLTGGATAEQRLSNLSARTLTNVDSAAVTCMRVNLYTTLDRSDRAVKVGLEYLRRVDGPWSRHPTEEDVRQDYDRLWRQLGSRSIEALLELPPMSDPDRCATMDVLTVLTSPALFTDLNLFRRIVNRMAMFSLEHGNSDGSCLAYAWLGGVLGTHFGDYQAGFRFGRLGLDLVEKHGFDRFRARVDLVFAVHVAHWTQPLQTSHALLRRAFEAAQDAGDLSYAAYSCIDLITNRIASGYPLDEVEQEAKHGLEFAQKVRFGLASDCITGQVRLIRMLRGLTPDFTSFDEDDFRESDFEHHLESNPQLAIGASYYWIRRLQASIYANDEASAVTAVSKVAPLLWTTPTQFELAEYHFYGALAWAAHCDSSTAAERSRAWEALGAHHKQLTVWAENCPATFANRAALIGAEMARLEGRELEAMRLYEEAIRQAREHGFIQNEGLAHECAARFCTVRGLQTIADAYVKNARRCYLSWGADGKVAQIDRLYPRQGEEPAAPAGTIGTLVEHLDLATVIKVFQAVSGEIVWEKLLDTLMRTAIQQAGAERGILIQLRGAEPRITAEATTGGDAVTVHLRDDTVSPAVLPELVLHYLLHTQETLLLDDASAQEPFSADPYVQQHHARSILGLPLLNHGKLIGLLYLENGLSPRVFAPARVAVLKMLASEAAISLENTRLYRDLAEREAKIRRLVDANVVGVLIADRDGSILEANNAFLDMVGFSRDDLNAGRLHWPELTPAEWQATSRRARDQIRASGRCDLFEKEYFRKDGGRVPVLIAAADISLSETVAFVLDLSDRKRAEEAVRRSEQELRQVIETVPAMVWTALPDGQVDFTSQRWQEFTGQSLEGSLGWDWRAAVHPEDREQHESEWRASLTTGQTFSVEMRLRRAADGEYRWCLDNAVPLRDEDGNILKWYGFTVDIEDRKRTEEVLQKMQAELAHVARVTTMGALTSSIAHEVNQPLAAIVTNASAALRWLARPAPNIEKAREALGRIVRDGQRAGEVIGRSRSLLRKTAITTAPVELNELIEETITLVRGEMRRHWILLRTELAEDLPAVAGDRVQLQQVILNLVMNGIEAMNEVTDSPRELVVTSRLEAPQVVLVAVKDAGIGLGPQTAERLFEPFYTTKAEGMGMGLGICRSIIEAHGGRLWAGANEPRGAVFQFTLPSAKDESVPSDRRRGPASGT